MPPRLTQPARKHHGSPRRVCRVAAQARRACPPLRASRCPLLLRPAPPTAAATAAAVRPAAHRLRHCETRPPRRPRRSLATTSGATAVASRTTCSRGCVPCAAQPLPEGLVPGPPLLLTRARVPRRPRRTARRKAAKPSRATAHSQWASSRPRTGRARPPLPPQLPPLVAHSLDDSRASFPARPRAARPRRATMTPCGRPSGQRRRRTPTRSRC